MISSLFIKNYLFFGLGLGYGSFMTERPHYTQPYYTLSPAYSEGE
jgi:hypothetical protein